MRNASMVSRDTGKVRDIDDIYNYDDFDDYGDDERK